MAKKSSKHKSSPPTLKTEVESLDDAPNSSKSSSSTSTSQKRTSTKKKDGSSTTVDLSNSKKNTQEKNGITPNYTFKKASNDEETLKVELDNVIEYEGYFYRGVVMVNEKAAKELGKLDQEKTQLIKAQIRN